MGDNNASLVNRLHAAVYRHIASNGLATMGGDGRTFYRIEAMCADHQLVALLHELGTPPHFDHNDKCAAVVSKIRECNCHVAETVRRIAAGESLPSPNPKGTET